MWYSYSLETRGAFAFSYCSPVVEYTLANDSELNRYYPRVIFEIPNIELLGVIIISTYLPK
jgi:hypothetical protein